MVMLRMFWFHFGFKGNADVALRWHWSFFGFKANGTYGLSILGLVPQNVSKLSPFAIVCTELRKHPFNVLKFQNLPFSVSSPLITGHHHSGDFSGDLHLLRRLLRRPSSSPATSPTTTIFSLSLSSFLPAGDHHPLRRPSWLLILVEIDRERGMRERKGAEKVRR